MDNPALFFGVGRGKRLTFLMPSTNHIGLIGKVRFIQIDNLNIIRARKLNAKDNMQYEVVGQHSAPQGNIIRDVVIRLTGQRTAL